MNHPLEPRRAVQDGCLMLPGVHIGQRSDINDGAPSKVLPVAREDVQRPEGRTLQEVGYAFSADGGNDVIHQTVAAEEQGQHTDQHDQRDEVRRSKNGLKIFGRLLPFERIERQRYNNGQRESDEKADDAQKEGVFHQRPELHVVEKPNEIVKSHPTGQRR